MSQKKIEFTNGKIPWINPIGGYGDVLMLSSVLKQVTEQFPGRKYNLIRRTKYLTFLKNHPAIAEIGYPPINAEIISTDYWAREPLGPNGQRAFQILARIFGLNTPVEEKLYVPPYEGDDPLLFSMIPWKEKNVLIAPATDSPRKMMPPEKWHQLVDMLKADGIFVLQAGRYRDVHIRNAYSILGLTTHLQLISLIKRMDVIVTPDNFIMHAAYLAGTRTVVMWGATLPEVYGYKEHLHLKGDRPCGLDKDKDCLIPPEDNKSTIYRTPCPMGYDFCMNRIPVERIYKAVINLVAEKGFNINQSAEYLSDL